MSLLDKIREEGVEWKRAWVFGFDPDLSAAAYCSYLFEYNQVGSVQPLSVWLGSFKPSNKKAKGMDKAVSMSQSIQNCQWYAKTTQEPVPRYALIEGQQAYFEADEPKKDIVSKANGLILLATINGAMISTLQSSNDAIDIKLVRPFDWKGNAQKNPMHEVFKSHILSKKVGCSIEGEACSSTAAQLDKISTHMLDAGCMALKSAEKIAKGTWK